MSTLKCALAGRCGGCPWIALPAAAQRQRRLADLRDRWQAAGLPAPPEPDWRSVGLGALRDRVDLSLRRVDGATILGMFAADGSGLVDVETCPLLTAPLDDWLADFRADLPDIERAGIRLRVGPDGQRQVWLDLPNETTRDLLSQRGWLSRLSEKAAVEIGQKRKDLVATPERLKLTRPGLKATFATWIRGEKVPLQGLVGGFSQPGMAANRVLVETVLEQVAATPAARWLELCAGSGNLTLPLADTGAAVTAWEVDRLALRALTAAAEARGLSVTAAPLNIHRASPRLTEALRQAAPDAILADPPRAGLGRFLEVLGASGLRPPIVYVSCAVESLTADIAQLAGMGYRVASLVGVEQFPHTPHGEWVVRLVP